MDFFIVNVLESFLGDNRKLNEETGQIQFDCPACSHEKGMVEGDGKGNLEVNYHRNVFKCWVCGDTNNMKGSIMKLLKKYATPKNIRDYLLVKPDADSFVGVYRERPILKLPIGYKRLTDCTKEDFKSDIALSYLKKRGITDEIIDEFDIGYTYKGDFFNRIIIPSYDSDGVLNYFIARWFDKQKTNLKYLNPDAEKQENIFNEGVLNLDATIYIVEGVFDHVATPNSIPLLGKVLSVNLLSLLHDKSNGLIVILLDDDAWLDALKIYKQLNFGRIRDKIRIIKSPKNYDPSKIFETFGSKGIVNLLKSAYKLKEGEY